MGRFRGAAPHVGRRSMAVDSGGVFAYKELGRKSSVRIFVLIVCRDRWLQSHSLVMNPHRNRHEGFMVSIMNPVTWHVVRRTILPGGQRWSSPDKRVAASLSLHDWNREPPTQVFCPSCDSCRRGAIASPAWWLMAGGALVAPPGPVINRLRAISRTVISGQWTAKGRARIIKADPGAGVPAISGGEPYSTATVECRRRCDTNPSAERRRCICPSNT